MWSNLAVLGQYINFPVILHEFDVFSVIRLSSFVLHCIRYLQTQIQSTHIGHFGELSDSFFYTISLKKNILITKILFQLSSYYRYQMEFVEGKYYKSGEMTHPKETRICFMRWWRRWCSRCGEEYTMFTWLTICDTTRAVYTICPFQDYGMQ